MAYVFPVAVKAKLMLTAIHCLLYLLTYLHTHMASGFNIYSQLLILLLPTSAIRFADVSNSK